jgi:hypothetical protein
MKLTEYETTDKFAARITSDPTAVMLARTLSLADFKISLRETLHHPIVKGCQVPESHIDKNCSGLFKVLMKKIEETLLESVIDGIAEKPVISWERDETKRIMREVLAEQLTEAGKFLPWVPAALEETRKVLWNVFGDHLASADSNEDIMRVYGFIKNAKAATPKDMETFKAALRKGGEILAPEKIERICMTLDGRNGTKFEDGSCSAEALKTLVIGYARKKDVRQILDAMKFMVATKDVSRCGIAQSLNMAEHVARFDGELMAILSKADLPDSCSMELEYTMERKAFDNVCIQFVLSKSPFHDTENQREALYELVRNNLLATPFMPTYGLRKITLAIRFKGHPEIQPMFMDVEPAPTT